MIILHKKKSILLDEFIIGIGQLWKRQSLPGWQSPRCQSIRIRNRTEMGNTNVWEWWGMITRGEWNCRVNVITNYLFFSHFTLNRRLAMHACLVTKSCPTLVTPRTVACQTLLSMEFPRQEYWSGLPLPTLGDLPILGSNPHLLHSLSSEPPGKPGD